MSRCLVVAEAGVNHENDLELAEKLVITAAYGGADAVKFQTYRADTISTRTATPYWESTETQHATFARLDKLPWSFYRDLVKLGDELGILVFSTPFDLEAVDMLDEAGVPWFKIASADLTYHRLLQRVASKGKPVILSTGAATWEEVVDAATILQDCELTLLHCTLKYPCPVEAIHLQKMVTMARLRPQDKVGLSDHSMGTAVPIAAAALGARMIEKHFTLDKGTPGHSPDHWLSVDPLELASMVKAIRQVEEALGEPGKVPALEEADAIRYARRSVTSKVDIAAGEVVTPDHVTCKRPGWGIPAEQECSVTGRKALVAIPADTTLTWDMFVKPFVTSSARPELNDEIEFR